MASVAKWLRQRLVVPPFGGSSPLIRPYNCEALDELIVKGFYINPGF